jgi:hypothetical protein
MAVLRVRHHQQNILLYRNPGYGLEGRGVAVRVPEWSRIITSPYRPDRLRGPTQPPIQRILGGFQR